MTVKSEPRQHGNSRTGKPPEGGFLVLQVPSAGNAHYGRSGEKFPRPDPFDLACSDCEVHYMECWEDITTEELHQLHDEQMADDANTPDWEIEEMKANGGWKPTIPDFEMWLRQAIIDGYIRVKA